MHDITESPDPVIGHDESVWGTEDALALTFTRRYQRDWRYVAAWGRWLVWDGQRWRSEDTLAATDLIRQVCRHAALQSHNPKTAAKLATACTVGGVERLARADRRHAATTGEWDADAWLLNTPGGVIDLRTGRQRPHERSDRMTRITTASLGRPGDEACPIWRQFLVEVTGGDIELQAYLQRMAGYALTGSTQEHALFFLYGTGANGKSVFVNTLATLLGDYAANAPMDTFMEHAPIATRRHYSAVRPRSRRARPALGRSAQTRPQTHALLPVCHPVQTLSTQIRTLRKIRALTDPVHDHRTRAPTLYNCSDDILS